ncbi:hypothetical protein UFOVP36_47 [uncultured Caudovirales phage]|uniref:Uncharacterized protein n=1 Tax=uncultured Caudovirales phage TaxID=2100421 RepID=A0A6J5KQC7_9CAUD|nr:hypothetical protein UFOVP36_47 [uncultured Caudovirales phage]
MIEFQTVEQMQTRIADLEAIIVERGDIIAAQAAEIETLKAGMTPDYYYGEGVEEYCFSSVEEVLEFFEDNDPFVEPTVLSVDTAIRGPKIWVSVTPAGNEDGFQHLEHESKESAQAAVAAIAAALLKEREEDADALRAMEGE